jgi:hypothetical protein
MIPYPGAIMSKPAKVLAILGVFLLIAGLLGWAATGFTDKGKTAIMSGAASGSILLISAWLSARPGVFGLVSWQIGLGFAALFGSTFIWRASIAWMDVMSGGDKLPIAILLSKMALATAVALFVSIRMKKAETAASLLP